jgi:hypothetical protein
MTRAELTSRGLWTKPSSAPTICRSNPMGGGRNPDGSRDVSDALDLLSTAGDAAGAASALFFTGVAAHHRGDLETACDRFERCTELNLPAVGARAVQLLGITKLGLGDVAGARAAFGAALPALVDIGDRFSILVGLTGLSGLAARSRKPRLALRLSGFVDAYGEINQVSIPQPLQRSMDQRLAPARSTAGAAAPWLLADGRQLTLNDALAMALTDRPHDRWPPGARADPSRIGGCRTGRPRADQPRDRRPAVSVRPDRRDTRRPHPDEAEPQHSNPARRSGARGRAAARQ